MRNKNFKKPNDDTYVVANEKIRSNKVRISNPETESYITTKEEAIKQAYDQDLDLVLINEKAEPPVCRIVNLNKYKYELKQRKKEAAKKQRESVSEQKEIRLGLNIDVNDLQTKARQAEKFLKANAKVTVTIILRGRERGKQNLARELLDRFANLIDAEYESINAQGNRVQGRIKD